MGRGETRARGAYYGGQGSWLGLCPPMSLQPAGEGENIKAGALEEVVPELNTDRLGATSNAFHTCRGR